MTVILLQDLKLIVLFSLIGSLIGLSWLGKRLSRPSITEARQ
jgi:hypothetical protein